MHLVFVTSIVPQAEPTTGYEIANAAIIDGLRRAGVKLTILGYCWPGGTPLDAQNTVVLGEIDVRTDTASLHQKLHWLRRAVASGLTFSSVKLRIATPAAIRAALSQIGKVDGYVLNSVQLAGAYQELFGDRPSLFVAHNVEHRSADENAAAASSLFQKMLFRREARLLRALERRLCDRASFVYTLADEDRAHLGVEERSVALPLVTKAAVQPPAPRQPVRDAALIGTWTWQPNRIGLSWFLDEVVPLLPSHLTIDIAGQMPEGIHATHPGIRFVGRVPDATQFLREARVVPLISRAGSGVQIKTIETFELGIPAVATSRSLRGISAVPDNCIVADDAAAFAAALTEAIRHPRPDLDGRAFHRDQMKGLDAAIALGLERLRQRLGRAAA